MEYALFDPITKAVTPVSGLLRAARAHENVGNLRRTEVGLYRVSSVFLFLDHGFWSGVSLWFETMVFHKENGLAELGCRRAMNFDECMARHICFEGELRLGWAPFEGEIEDGKPNPSNPGE